jgi:hypothetical protein
MRRRKASALQLLWLLTFGLLWSLTGGLLLGFARNQPNHKNIFKS